MPYLNFMCPNQLKSAIKKKLPLFIATGSTEYHGSQLPLGTDLMITEGIIREIEKRTDIVVAPPFTFCPTGNMVSGADKGTVDVHIGTFIGYCADVLGAYKKMGFENIYILVHHQGGNISEFLQCALKQINSYSLYEQYGDGWWSERKQINNTCNIEIAPAVFGDEEIRKSFGGHGGIGETQAIMALYPEYVRMDYLTDNEAWWNGTANEADKMTADKYMEQLIELWIDKIKY